MPIERIILNSEGEPIHTTTVTSGVRERLAPQRELTILGENQLFYIFCGFINHGEIVVGDTINNKDIKSELDSSGWSTKFVFKP